MTGEDDGAGSRGAATTGVVLAGGRSTRFDGGDKALATVDGDAMLARVVDALAATAGSVVVNCREDQRAAFAAVLDDAAASVRFAVDDRPDEGPLVGLDRALDVVETPVVVVAACDLPHLEGAVVARLAAELGGDDAPDAVVPVDDDGYRKPTCAAYRTDALAAAVDAALAADSRRLRDALDGLDVREVDASGLEASSEAFADVDTREGLAAAEGRERRDRGGTGEGRGDGREG